MSERRSLIGADEICVPANLDLITAKTSLDGDTMCGRRIGETGRITDGDQITVRIAGLRGRRRAIAGQRQREDVQVGRVSATIGADKTPLADPSRPLMRMSGGEPILRAKGERR